MANELSKEEWLVWKKRGRDSFVEGKPFNLDEIDTYDPRYTAWYEGFCDAQDEYFTQERS